MISVTGVTGNYILQPALLEKHTLTIQWLSSTALWKGELAFMQQLLDENAYLFESADEKQKISHIQNLVTYYSAEVLIGLRKKLRDHENNLARMLELKDETNIHYFKEHDQIMAELESFAKQFTDLKAELFNLIQEKKTP